MRPRQGFAHDANEVQGLWLEDTSEAAADRVSAEIASQASLLGTPGMICDRLRVYREAGVTTLRACLRGATVVGG